MQRLRVGDFVQVIAGKNKGKRGKITHILGDQDRVVIEGLNMVTRHTRPSQRNAEGGRLQKEAPIHASNVMPIDATSDKPTRVKIQVVDSADEHGAPGPHADGKKTKRRTAKGGGDLKAG